ncbi:7458_t:CDS:2 [Paraglomus occultum]|uniref:7458_t:CDS:1 n=1 Tax=Paraglomus occultum TaxID=144539 RepID=A0A9N9FXL5_9GLOM|nr:7458_t:CDS:2 [Paraglomus occultum]
MNVVQARAHHKTIKERKIPGQTIFFRKTVNHPRIWGLDYQNDVMDPPKIDPKLLSANER